MDYGPQNFKAWREPQILCQLQRETISTGIDEETVSEHNININKSLNSTSVNKCFCCCKNSLKKWWRGDWQAEMSYFFISKIALPGPRFLALQMLQNCAAEFMLGMGRHSLWNMCRQWKTTTLKGLAASDGRTGERHDSQMFSSSTRTPFIWVRCIFFSKDKESATRIFLQPSRSRICKL